MTEYRCSDCAHAYITVSDLFSAPFEAFGTTVCCDLIRPDQGHVGSYVGMNSPTCKHYKTAPRPIRVYPEETPQMMKARQWWTDIVPEPAHQEPQSSQRTLDLF